MELFADDGLFRTAFADKLRDILQAPQLGTFILVLANSMQDRESRELLASDLKTRFGDFLRNLPNAPPDDLDVFRKLEKSGLDDLNTWSQRKAGPWDLVYNPLRALRPPRSAGATDMEMKRAFDPDGFHFNKPFLRSEILWEGKHADYGLRVLYNKFPFIPYHLIIAPEPQSQHSQFLTQDKHALAFELLSTSRINGFGLAYNSLCAYASINHLHFHGYVRETAFAVEHPDWRHNGGSRDYPTGCMKFDDVDTSWPAIHELQESHQPFNVIYRSNTIYVLPRQPQGANQFAPWCPNPAWHELAGTFTLSDKGTYDTLSAEAIESALSRLSVS